MHLADGGRHISQNVRRPGSHLQPRSSHARQALCPCCLAAAAHAETAGSRSRWQGCQHPACASHQCSRSGRCGEARRCRRPPAQRRQCQQGRRRQRPFRDLDWPPGKRVPSCVARPPGGRYVRHDGGAVPTVPAVPPGGAWAPAVAAPVQHIVDADGPLPLPAATRHPARSVRGAVKGEAGTLLVHTCWTRLCTTYAGISACTQALTQATCRDYAPIRRLVPRLIVAPCARQLTGMRATNMLRLQWPGLAVMGPRQPCCDVAALHQTVPY